MRARRSPDTMRRTMNFVGVVLLLAVLVLGRELLVPMALAIFATAVLHPIVRRLVHWHIPRPVAVVAVVLLSCGVVGGLIATLTAQTMQLAAKVPDYRENIIAKIRAVKAGGNSMEGVVAAWQSISNEIATTQSSGVAAVPVKVLNDSQTMSSAADWLSPVLQPLGTTAVVFMLTFFMLMSMDLIRERFFWLAGTQRISVSSAALSDAGQRISRYLRAQLLINASYGLCVGASLYFIGLPNAIFWGLLAGLLRYIPYIGAWIAMGLPTLFAIAIFPNWTRPIEVFAALLALELLVNLVLEPLFYGASTGVSALGVILSSFFWAWVWGPVGLVLAVPMTVCIVVGGRHVVFLRTLSRLLGSDPLLPQSADLYRELIAWDEDAAVKRLSQQLKTTDLATVTEQLLFPTIIRLKRDGMASNITEEQARFALDFLNRWACEQGAQTRDTAARVLVVAVRGAEDDSGASVMACLLRHCGCPSIVMRSAALAREVSAAAREPYDAVILVDLEPNSESRRTHLRTCILNDAPSRRTIEFVFPGAEASASDSKSTEPRPGEEVRSTIESLLTVLNIPHPTTANAEVPTLAAQPA